MTAVKLKYKLKYKYNFILLQNKKKFGIFYNCVVSNGNIVLSKITYFKFFYKNFFNVFFLMSQSNTQ